MIASIKGRIVRKGTQQIVLEQSGIGFLIEMPA
ncbi:MAG: Holliday junction branch migration protein RuvA, partial [Clostridiaceae bacterium]|nr:Holliday junction branch migration protein RuvA [Clostridiaceae bacterium]